MKISLEEIQRVANQGPFYPDWDSLAAYQVPRWFKRAKFGIFILQSSCLWERVVLSKYVHPGYGRI